jgi:hypothetical protein
MRNAIILLGICLMLGCESMGPPNTDLDLRVEASVRPLTLRLRDSAAVLSLSVTVTNPSDQDIIVTTGGPPYRITPDPLESSGLGPSIRIASSTDPLNGGPSVDWWGSPVDTIRAGSGMYAAHDVTLESWRGGGWKVEPGTYQIRSYYNGREGLPATLTVLP